MFTDFGKMLKKLMVDVDISQGQLAKELGISPSILSNYLSGKNIPTMELIEKCRERFNLRNEGTKEIFAKAFLSSAQSSHAIHLDIRFFNPKRLDLLVKAILVFMLYPEDPNFIEKPFDPELRNLGHTISDYYKSLDNRMEYKPPLEDANDKASPKTNL
jgi:transcriptional regulator with XRE-family HTH domain